MLALLLLSIIEYIFVIVIDFADELLMEQLVGDVLGSDSRLIELLLCKKVMAMLGQNPLLYVIKLLIISNFIPLQAHFFTTQRIIFCDMPYWRMNIHYL